MPVSHSRVAKSSLRKKILFASVPLLLLFGMSEILSLAFLTYNTTKNRQMAARRVNPAYTSRPWFNETFLQSSFQQPGGWRSPEGATFILPHDYQDQYFTVTEGVRRTTGFSGTRNEQQQIKLFTLGGSTTYCSEVPDHLTYPSQLQKRLSENAATKNVRVHNLGVTTVNSHQEVDRLKFEIARGNVPDICIFLDGINDVHQGVYNKNVTGTIFGQEKQYQRKNTLWRIAKNSATARLLANLSTQMAAVEIPPHLESPTEVRRLTELTADHYEDTMLEAQRICDRHNILMIAFIQPTTHTTPREILQKQGNLEAINGEIINGSDQHAAYRTAFVALKGKIKTLKQKDIHAFDITDAFASTAQPIFLDATHVNDVGNAILSNIVFERSLPLIERHTAEIAARSEQNVVQ